MGKARTFSDSARESVYQKEFDDEVYNTAAQQNSYNLGSVHFSDQSGIANITQAGTDQRKANLKGALYTGNIGFELQTAVLDVGTETIDLLEDATSTALSLVSTDRIVTLSAGTTSDLVTILGAQRPGQRLTLYNILGNTITIKHTSTATDNTILTPDNADFTFTNNMAINLVFDITTTKWRIVGAAAGSGGGGYNIIQNEGTPLTQRTTMNFLGTAVNAVDNPGTGVTDITITAGAGNVPDGTAQFQHLEWNGTSWINQQTLDFGANSATNAQLNIPNDIVGISWRNAANDNDIGLRVDSSDKFILNIGVGNDVLEISSSQVDVKTLDVINVDRLTFVEDSGAATSTDIPQIYVGGGGGQEHLIFNNKALEEFIWTSDNITKMILTDSTLEKRNVTAPVFQLYNTIAAQTGTAGSINFLANSTDVSTGISMGFLIADTEAIAGNGRGSLKQGVNLDGTPTLFLTMNEGNDEQVDILKETDFNANDVLNVNRLQISGGTASATSVNDVVWYLDSAGNLVSNVNATDGWIWSSGNITKMILTDSTLEKRNVTAPSFQLYNTIAAQNGTAGTINILANSQNTSTGVTMGFIIGDTEDFTGDGRGSLKLGVNLDGVPTLFATLNEGDDEQVDILKTLDMNTNDILNMGGETINSLTVDATPDCATDFVMTYDASTASLKKVLLDNLPGGASQTPWLSDIDADNFNLFDLDSLIFQSTAGTLGSLNVGFSALGSGGFRANVLNNGDFEITEENTLHFSFDGGLNSINVIDSLFAVSETSTGDQFSIAQSSITTTLTATDQMDFFIGASNVFDIISGGIEMADDKFISNVDQIGFRNIGNLIEDDANGLIFTTIPGDEFTWDDGTNTFAILDIDGLFLNDMFIQIDSITAPTTTGLDIGKIFMDSGNSNHLSVVRDTTVIDLETGGGAADGIQDFEIPTEDLDIDGDVQEIFISNGKQGYEVSKDTTLQEDIAQYFPVYIAQRSRVTDLGWTNLETGAGTATFAMALYENIGGGVNYPGDRIVVDTSSTVTGLVQAARTNSLTPTNIEAGLYWIALLITNLQIGSITTCSRHDTTGANSAGYFDDEGNTDVFLSILGFNGSETSLPSTADTGMAAIVENPPAVFARLIPNTS